MQVANVNLPITVSGRHTSVTEAMREHALDKVKGLHLDYPRIIEAKVILDVQNTHRHLAEIVLHCANHITIEADTTTDNMYTSIDETIHKIARRMRKYKTRMLKSHRPRGKDLRHMPSDTEASDHIADFVNGITSNGDAPEELEGPTEFDTAFLVHRNKQSVKPLTQTEAVEELELGSRPFVTYKNVESGQLRILFRRQDGDYEVVVPEGFEA